MGRWGRREQRKKQTTNGELYEKRHGKGMARQGKARQGKARQGKVRQGKTRQDKAREAKANARLKLAYKNVRISEHQPLHSRQADSQLLPQLSYLYLPAPTDKTDGQQNPYPKTAHRELLEAALIPGEPELFRV